LQGYAPLALTAERAMGERQDQRRALQFAMR
jgi:hypothetical protein